MTPKEIHQTLKARYSDGVAEWQDPKAGDPSLGIHPSSLHEVCAFLRDEPPLSFDFLRLVTGLDRGTVLSSVYHLYSYRHQHGITLHVDLPRESPSVASVTDLWPAADWLERECYDMLGIQYQGHPNLKRILLPADWEGHPLRKDYKQPDSYHGIAND